MSTAMLHFSIIDTLQLSKRMQKAGLDQKVADELAEVIKESNSHSTESLATKEDLKAIEQTSKQDFKLFEQMQKQDLKSLDQSIKSLDKDLRNEMESLRNEMESLSQSLNQSIKSLDKDLRQEMELLKKDIVIKLGSLIALAVGIIAALIKL